MSHNKTYPCPYAAKGAVYFEKKDCEKCGWYPEVAARRTEAIMQKLKEEAEQNERKKSMGKNPGLLR